jgi:hypothetical protein
MAAQCSSQKQINSSDDEVLWEIDHLLHMRACRFETTKTLSRTWIFLRRQSRHEWQAQQVMYNCLVIMSLKRFFKCPPARMLQNDFFKKN